MQPLSVITYIALGSNLNDPKKQVLTGFSALKKLPHCYHAVLSPLYETEAQQLPNTEKQPDYVNAVAQLETTLSARELLSECQRIEVEQDRVRTERWGARTLDLDILLYGEQMIESAELTIPHPRLKTRAFVIKPLLDLAPELKLPDGTFLKDYKIPQ